MLPVRKESFHAAPTVASALHEMRWAAWSRSLREKLWVMNIHEYQAKELLAKFGAPVPAGYAAFTAEEAAAAAEKLPGPLYVVKAQIHAGGRGKGKFVGAAPDRPEDGRVGNGGGSTGE